MAAAVGAAGYLTARRVIRASVLEELEARAEVAAGRIEVTVDAVARGAHALAGTPVVAAAIRDPAAAERQLVPVLRDFADLAAAPLHLAVTDPDGRTVACSLHERQSRFLGAGWLPAVVNRSETVIEIVAGDEGPVILLALPVSRSAGSPAVGALAAEIPLEPIVREPAAPGARRRFALVVSRGPEGPSGTRTLDDLYLIADRPLALGAFRGARVHLRVMEPHAVAFHRLHQLAAVTGGGVIALLILASGFVWFLSGRLTRGVRTLSAAVQRAAAEQRLGARVPDSGDDEVADLGAAFNGLLARLEAASAARLARQVERTQGAKRALRFAYAAVELATEAIEVVTTDGLVVFSNAAAVRLRAESSRAESGLRFEAIFGKEPAWWDQTLARLREERRVELALRVRERGERIPVGVSLAHLELWGEELCVATVRDLRERLRSEATDRLASLGTLAAGVAHEINNPLAYVLGNLEFLRERLGSTPCGEGEEERRALTEAIEGAGRVRDVVRSLRAYTREGSGALVRVDVAEELRGALQLVGSTVRHRARLVEQIGPTPPVLARRSELAQVFVNLLVNAAQAVKPGADGDAEIVVRCFATPDGRAAIEVADDGVGIPLEHQGRVFDPFFTTREVGGGTGLGLSICHGIVTRLGGTIAFESEPGVGTCFRVLLPADVAATAGAPVEPDAGGGAAPHERGVSR